MRVRYSFSSRRNGQITKMRKQKQEFPKLLLKIIETSDIILQVLDSRYVEQTRNVKIEELILNKGKKIIYVLNKSDLTDTSLIKKSNYIKELKPYSIVSAKTRHGVKELREKIKYMARKAKEKDPHYQRTQVGVIGYPNAGKSSLINVLVGKSSAKTGAEAGFTKGIQKLRLTKEILLLDSPGVIPASEYSSIDPELMSKHIMVGARDFNKVKDPEVVLAHLFKENKEVFQKFYKLKPKETDEELIEKLGEEKNMYKKKGEIATDRVARSVLKDWQAGRIR